MSTELALLTQKDIIIKSFESKKLIMGIFVDFSKALDSINHHTLSEKLEYYGFVSRRLLFLRRGNLPQRRRRFSPRWRCLKDKPPTLQVDPLLLVGRRYRRPPQ